MITHGTCPVTAESGVPRSKAWRLRSVPSVLVTELRKGFHMLRNILSMLAISTAALSLTGCEAEVKKDGVIRIEKDEPDIHIKTPRREIEIDVDK